MKAGEYFPIWKKKQGINYVEGQEDLFKFAEAYATHELQESVKEITEMKYRIEELVLLCEGYESFPEAVGGECMYCGRLESEH